MLFTLRNISLRNLSSGIYPKGIYPFYHFSDLRNVIFGQFMNLIVNVITILGNDNYIDTSTL